MTTFFGPPRIYGWGSALAFTYGTAASIYQDSYIAPLADATVLHGGVGVAAALGAVAGTLFARVVVANKMVDRKTRPRLHGVVAWPMMIVGAVAGTQVGYVLSSIAANSLLSRDNGAIIKENNSAIQPPVRITAKEGKLFASLTPQSPRFG